MNNVVRAWKDETYRQSLSVEQLAVLPANPAGEIELTDVELEAISGAAGSGSDSNKTQQDADQASSVTFGNYTVVVDDIVWCYAPNSANASANTNSGVHF
jgi:mersacidin/lichenicidin family type 2 lantibiotic